ncbi:hypothetical protein F4825DRAFT_316813 [Nemania diffusa]|nr:hypothetical protein F4825DRAFT_316813 [Nemania diffusa]
MPLSNVSAKQLCLRVLLWSGLLFNSLLCDDEPPGQTTSELLVLGPGPPPFPTTTLISTITITTTLGYAPSLIPGNSQYGLAGCYAQPSQDGGLIFGADQYNAWPDKVPSSNRTADECLRSCGLMAPASSGTKLYMYAGLRNGSECLCGVQLSTDARILSANNCTTPCLGDPRLSCGGKDNVAIYSLISGAKVHTEGSQSGSGSSTKQPITTQPLGSSSTIDTSSKSNTPKKAVSGPTIAAITASLAGAVILTAGIYLYYRAVRRETGVQDAHVKPVPGQRGRKPTPNPITTRANAIAAGARHKRNTSETGDHDRGFRGRDFIPNTPGLESGAKSPAGLHARTAASHMGTAAPEERDGPRGGATMMGEIRRGSATLRTHSPAAGASSAVQWRPDNSGPLSPSTTRERALSSSGAVVASPPPSAKAAGLGERAWHRRKLSTPYQPYQPPPPPSSSAGVGPGAAGVGAGAAAGAVVAGNRGGGGRGVGRGNMARRGPLSGPPAALPPMPPIPPGARVMAQPRAQTRSRDVPGGLGTAKGPGGNSSARRPRSSSDTTVLEPQLKGESESEQPPVTGDGSNKGNALGMSQPNMSTPSLGRYGSILRYRNANAESPVLGWRRSDGRGQWSAAPHGARGGEDPLEGREPTIPVLPPVAPGERFDHRRWRGTIYTSSPGTDKGGKQPQQQGREGQENIGDESSPVSASSVGTSILYDAQEFDRRL